MKGFQCVADDQAPDYQTAVRMADTALAAILDQLQRADSTYPGRATAETTAGAGQFAEWLQAHPGALAALEAVAGFESSSFEGYIEAHSAAFAMGYDDTVGLADALVVFRRPNLH